jgi:mRNA (guanine-N7-)-methyltransferase
MNKTEILKKSELYKMIVLQICKWILEIKESNLLILSQFPGSIINNVDVEKLTHIFQSEYFNISYKLNGTRSLLMYLDEKSRNKHIMKTGWVLINYKLDILEVDVHLNNNINALYDGELILHKGQIDLFIICDVLYINKSTLLNTLNERMNFIDPLIKCENDLCYDTIKINKINIFYKTYYNLDKLKYLLDTINNIDYDIDGIVFTPNNTPYKLFNNPLLLKWKIINTFDFIIIYMNNPNYDKEVNLSKETWKYQQMKYHLAWNIQNPTLNLVTRGELHPAWIKNTPLYKLKNIIVECYPELNENNSVKYWNFYKTRNDKQSINSKSIVEKGIINRIFKNNLLEIFDEVYVNKKEIPDHIISNLSKQVKLDYKKKTYRDMNNLIKKILFMHTIIPNDTVLDLCCGKAGDIHKFAELKVKLVSGFDNDENAIEEAKKRANTKKKSCNTTIFNYELANVFDNLFKYKLKQKYNIISCMFAIHYAFSKIDIIKNFIKTMDDSILLNGKIIITTIDYDMLNNYIKNDKLNTSLYTITLQDNFNKTKFGQCYKFKLENLVQDITEFVVIPKILLELTNNVGWLLDNDLSHNFEILKNKKIETKAIWNTLSKDEQLLVSFYRSYVFIKT